MAIQANPTIIPDAYAGKVEPKVPSYITNLSVFPGPVGIQPIVSWDVPSYSGKHASISGVNVYRSYTSPFEGYKKINIAPVTIRVYNDNLTMKFIDEKPMSKSIMSLHGRDYLALRASNRVFSNLFLSEETSYLIPIAENRQFNSSQKNFLTQVYGEVLWKGQRIYPSYVDNDIFYIDLTPYLGDNQAITAYVNGEREDYQLRYFTCQASPYDLLMENRVHYKVIPLNHKGEEIVSLEDSPYCSYQSSSDFSWVWTAALRRNLWLLWFGGEDCEVWLRKYSGEPCPCQSASSEQTYECSNCLGTGFVGGYVGPYTIKILYENTTRSRAVNDFGSRMREESRGIFLPVPLLRSGDVVIRKSGQKMVLGEVEVVTNRGTVMQLEFSLGDCQNSLKGNLPSVRGVHKYFSIPDHPDQVNTQKGAEPTFSHLQLGLY